MTKYNIHPDFEPWSNFKPKLNKVSLFFMQQLMNLSVYSEKSDDLCDVEKLEIPNSGKKIKALLYSPKVVSKNCPCLVYFHGGGFVLPAAPYHYQNARKYAVMCGCKVLFVDYPLAPKNKFPTQINACYKAYCWILRNSKKFSINKNKIAVGGDSAGGNFASVISMKAQDNKITKPCGQMLIYPAAGFNPDTPSMQKYTDTPMCNSVDCKKYAKLYFSNIKDMTDKYACPMNAQDFSIFPPTYIETAEFDCLKDEAIEYSKKLNRAGVKTTLNNTLQTMHGYDIVQDCQITKDNLEKRIEFLKKIFS